MLEMLDMLVRAPENQALGVRSYIFFNTLL